MDHDLIAVSRDVTERWTVASGVDPVDHPLKHGISASIDRNGREGDRCAGANGVGRC